MMRNTFIVVCTLILSTWSSLAFATKCAMDSDCLKGQFCNEFECTAEKPASKKTSKEQPLFCQYDYECPADMACSNTRCVTVAEKSNESATDACGHDRRCRMERLKRKNIARRHLNQVSNERRLKTDLAHMQKEKLKEKPRVLKPLSMGLIESRLGPFPGVYGGWTFAGQVRATADYQFSNLTSFSGNGEATAKMHFITAAGEVMLFPGGFTPYLRGGFKLGTGEFDSFSYDAFGGFRDSSGSQATWHALEAGAGFDVQLDFGLHFKLGLAYRATIYRQVEIDPGVYDAVGKESLDDLIKECVAFDVVGALGWAF